MKSSPIRPATSQGMPYQGVGDPRCPGVLAVELALDGTSAFSDFSSWFILILLFLNFLFPLTTRVKLVLP